MLDWRRQMGIGVAFTFCLSVLANTPNTIKCEDFFREFGSSSRSSLGVIAVPSTIRTQSALRDYLRNLARSVEGTATLREVRSVRELLALSNERYRNTAIGGPISSRETGLRILELLNQSNPEGLRMLELTGLTDLPNNWLRDNHVEWLLARNETGELRIFRGQRDAVSVTAQGFRPLAHTHPQGGSELMAEDAHTFMNGPRATAVLPSAEDIWILFREGTSHIVIPSFVHGGDGRTSATSASPEHRSLRTRFSNVTPIGIYNDSAVLETQVSIRAGTEILWEGPIYVYNQGLPWMSVSTTLPTDFTRLPQ